MRAVVPTETNTPLTVVDDIVQAVESLPLTSAQTAHDRLRAGDVRGRLVLTP